MSLTPGTHLGSYKIVSLLGAGGMGEVYRAKDLKLGRDVAIKVLREDLASDPERLRRFEQEARAASSLNHPNIITIYDIGKHNSTSFIAMEYVEGNTLREMLGGEPLPTKKVLHVATQISEGLAKAHSAEIVHRDLKPENLMVTSDGFVKILDFGLAKLTPQLSEASSEGNTLVKGGTTPGVVMGTVGYMSPEQAKGQPSDFRSDQFSLGTVLYEMATGKRAFRHDTLGETQAAIIRDEPEPITQLTPNLPPPFRWIVERCLAKDPKERYASTQDLAHELQNVRDHLDEVPSAPFVAEPQPTVWLRRAGMLSLAGLLVAVLALTVGLNVGGLRERLFGGATPGLIESIAVLPLENLSGDPEQEYFADGMTDELISQLAQIGSLRVISRTSVMQYKDVRKPLPEIARELDVDVVVEGTVRRAEGRVRITAQLVEASTDRHLWAKSFERELRDVLALQSEMAQAIAQEIRSTLTPQEAERFTVDQATDPGAYEAYLKGRDHFHKLDVEGFERAIEYYEEAIEKDPGFALGYAGRAQTYINLELWGALRPGEGFGEARRAALRATDLDGTLAKAHVVLAVIQFRHDWDFARAESTFRRAIVLNPSDADAHVHYSYFLTAMGRHNEAIEQAKEALKVDPLSREAHMMLADSYQGGRQYDLALSAYQDVSKKWPTMWNSAYQLAQMYTLLERLPEALLAAESSAEVTARNPWALAQLGSIYGLMGRDDDARAVLEELEEKRSREHVPALALAWVNMGLGEKDRAVEWLETAYVEREGWLVEVYRWPLWDSLHDHPGFVDIFRRMNLPE